MEDRRLMEFYRITICKNGMVVPSQREMIRRRERKLERRKNSLSRKELFAELDKLVEEQKQKHKSVIEENEEENSVENTSLNDDDDDRCLEIAIEEAKQKAAEMEEEMKNNKKKKRRGRRGKPKEEKGNEESRKDSDTTQEVVCEPSKGEHLRIYGLLEGDVKLVYKIVHRLVEVCDLGSIVRDIRVIVLRKIGQERFFKMTGNGITNAKLVNPLTVLGNHMGF